MESFGTTAIDGSTEAASVWALRTLNSVAWSVRFSVIPAQKANRLLQPFFFAQSYLVSLPGL